jgi:hypothetical protein
LDAAGGKGEEREQIPILSGKKTRLSHVGLYYGVSLTLRTPDFTPKVSRVRRENRDPRPLTYRFPNRPSEPEEGLNRRMYQYGKHLLLEHLRRYISMLIRHRTEAFSQELIMKPAVWPPVHA